MNTETDTRRAVAEEVRLIHKELGWVVKHLARVHTAIRTEDSLPLDTQDPNQLTLFPSANE